MKYLVGADDQGFAHTVGLGEPRDTANAKLIISAPELLAERDQLRERVDELAEALGWILQADRGSRAFESALSSARVALSKIGK